MNWTPYEISVVLHHYVSSSPFPHKDAPIYRPTIDKLWSLGVLSITEMEVTELGKALIDQWLRTPLPIVKYVDPRFETSGTEEALQ
ncbi:hypothetical protein [Rhizobium phage RHEph18]|uniref:hypothetical protein n=1 Tax=Rhizobium TaxID=379 RepID=UPI0007E937F9|nr:MULTISPECIES: hypothetical protein [Rhizobium]ANL02678.1 hypothetical protein AMJ99_CH01091 [Rhizobium esperanzae]ANM33530.1 hypothetical protein AMK04_CH01092 [Rhizobium sp. N871]QIG73763.1 hypothetical protein EVC05_071 [Rhizobium phage RHph_N2]QXV74481.1 hypothetical protein [Rhizobium phage RHEph18]